MKRCENCHCLNTDRFCWHCGADSGRSKDEENDCIDDRGDLGYTDRSDSRDEMLDL
jgi:hypothetical protein